MKKCKLCKDCRWHVHSDVGYSGQFDECHAPQNRDKRRERSVCCVTGNPIPEPNQDHWRYTFCTTQREDGWFSARLIGSCGKRGRWWEPKAEG